MNWLKINSPTNAAEPVEMSIYGPVGKDWWSDEGVASGEFIDELNKIPKGRKINLRINSEGGNVWDGLPIYNRLKERSADVTAYVDGICASIASVIMLAAGKIVVPKNALIMIHNASGMAIGNAAVMEKMAAVLRTHDKSIASVYREETGQSVVAVWNAMDAETWFTGEEAVAWGLADELKGEAQIAASYDLSRFRHVPESLAPHSANTTRDTMKILLDPTAAAGGATALALAEPPKPSLPVTPPPPAPVAALQSGPISPIGPPQPGADSTVRAELDVIKSTLAAERRKGIEATVDRCISEGRIQAAQRTYWINSSVQDQATLQMIQDMPEMSPLSPPLNQHVEIVAESLQDIFNYMVKVRKPQMTAAKGAVVPAKDLKDSAINAALFHTKHRNRLLPIINANTIPTELKRQVILQEIMRAFKLRLMPLQVFSTIFSSVPLQGTDKIDIPYYPLVSAASTDFVQANGYVMGDYTQTFKEVTVNKRKYQPVRINSQEMNRFPTLNIGQIAMMKAEKLASDVFLDVLSVVTVANFGATPTALLGAVTAFDHVDVADAKGIADVADWPDVGRSLVTNSAINVNMLKDTSIISALNFGSSDPIQNGDIKQIYGFTYYMNAKIPANAETLVGFICMPSAILVATSPIQPTEEVRGQLTAYEVVTDPQIGISFEYRRWGNPDFDETREVIECNYGYAVGESAALKRISTA